VPVIPNESLLLPRDRPQDIVPFSLTSRASFSQGAQLTQEQLSQLTPSKCQRVFDLLAGVISTMLLIHFCYFMTVLD
jgi:hypothetical protein